MKEYTPTEFAVGIFVLVGLLALAYLSVSIGGLELGVQRIPVMARFASVGDLKEGAAVKIAGVKVGKVDSVRLENYAAEVQLAVDAELAIPSDTIASIRTEGLLGESYVLLRPGGAETDLEAGDRIPQTEPALDLIDLLVKYALSGGEGDSEGDAAAEDPFGSPF